MPTGTPNCFWDFILKVEQIERVSGMGYCWEWQGHRNRQGYGRIRVACKDYRVHRIAYALSTGADPGRLSGVVMHKCDNPCCCNPRHLQLGTAKDNTQDSIDKQRHAKGSKNGRAKLTEEQVANIKQTPKGMKGLAKKYGVHNNTINQIRRGKTWQH